MHEAKIANGRRFYMFQYLDVESIIQKAIYADIIDLCRDKCYINRSLGQMSK